MRCRYQNQNIRNGNVVPVGDVYLSAASISLILHPKPELYNITPDSLKLLLAGRLGFVPSAISRPVYLSLTPATRLFENFTLLRNSLYP